LTVGTTNGINWHYTDRYLYTLAIKSPPMAIALFIAGAMPILIGSKCCALIYLFFIGIVIFLLIAIAIPEIATWLPSIMRD